MNLRKVFVLSAVLLAGTFLSGCGFLSDAYSGFVSVTGLSSTCTVIAKKANIRTSYAVVAQDLFEVKRGDVLDVVDQVDFEKTFWYRVRAHDEDQTEGWIEAQNVITSEVLEKSKKLAEEDKDAQPQANGLLRNKTNLRLSPEQSNENILVKLDNGSTFEIMAWKFVPKAEDTNDDTNRDDANKPKKTKNAEIEAAKTDEEPEKMDEKYDVWYKVRLDPSVSPAPSGWIFGRQVELQVPTDIVFFQQNNRKFVTWQRLDADSANKVGVGDKSLAPGNWVVLSRSNFSKPIDGVEPDFDGIVVLAFDKYDQSYYTVWRSAPNTEVWGTLPLKVDGKGDSKTFTVHLRNPSGQMDEKRFIVF